ncbi:FAD-dependent oxidoreductase [Mesorhizobium sp. B2-5-13]|nr:FAD-dependent oxidoreductase [Mesorhizobium sp. B2-5-13]TPK45938.1 FAD-dependent oxidoreductase [Mesorhizobium sp. B2-5-5]
MDDSKGTGPVLPRPDADVIVVGAGPAGMSAASELAAAGCSVIVLDMQPSPGGQIFRGLEANVSEKGQASDLLRALGESYRAGSALITRFRAARSIDYRDQTTVWEVRPDGTVGWLRGADAGYLRARHVLLAHGAMERPAPFPGWTLPGVMTAGAVQTLLKAGRMKPVGRVVLAGSGPLILLLADQLRRLGSPPVLIARTDRLSDSVAAIRHLRIPAIGDFAKGVKWLAELHGAHIKMASGILDLEALGQDKVEEVRYSIGRRRSAVRCDLLVVHDGIIPSLDLSVGAGLTLEWDGQNASWRPRTREDGTATAIDDSGRPDQLSRIRVTGDARRIAGADAAIAHGRVAALAILEELNKPRTRSHETAQAAMSRAIAARPFLDAAFPPGLSTHSIANETIVCRCEELSAGLLRERIGSGATDINLLRAETRCGMGPCQGRNCMTTLSRLIAEQGPGATAAPAFRGRPPIRPLPLRALAHLSGLDPVAAQMKTLEDKPDAGEPPHASAS